MTTNTDNTGICKCGHRLGSHRIVGPSHECYRCRCVRYVAKVMRNKRGGVVR